MLSYAITLNKSAQTKICEPHSLTNFKTFSNNLIRNERMASITFSIRLMEDSTFAMSYRRLTFAARPNQSLREKNAGSLYLSQRIKN